MKKKPKFFIYKFYAIGNGGIECFTTYRVYDKDPAKNEHLDMEDMTDDILGGNYSSGVRSIHWDLVENPDKALIDKMTEQLKSSNSYMKRKIDFNKTLIDLMK